MIYKTFIIIFIINLPLVVLPQTSSYLGKKNFFCISPSIDCRLMALFDKRNEGTPLQSVPISAELLVSINNKMSMGVNQTITRNHAIFRQIHYNYNTYSGDVVFRANTTSLFTEWSGDNGFSMTYTYSRIGLFISTFQNVKYKKLETTSGSILENTSFIENDELFKLKQKNNLFGFYYSFGKRIPLNDRFLFSFGLSGIVAISEFLNLNVNKNEIEEIGSYRIARNDFARIDFSLFYAF